MCQCFCNGVIGFMWKAKKLQDDTHLFSPKELIETNDKIIPKYFQ